MTTILPTVSVVIPTHNRSALLRNTLSCLSNQTYPLQRVEVLVVTDGCTGETREILRNFEAPFTLKVLEQPGQGPGGKRNHGAANASGQLLIFLDDDIEVEPQLIEAHVRAHQLDSEQVVIGYFPPLLKGRGSFFRMDLRDWWESQFQAMRQPGHRYTYRDLLSGNFSLKSDLFARVNGFNTSYTCRDDYELGARLLKAGATFSHCADARGYHHDATDIDRLFQRKYQEGVADTLLGCHHPELRPTLRMKALSEYSSLRSRILRVLAFKWPAVGDVLVTRFLRPLLGLFEKLRMRGRWRRLCFGLQNYFYWRGVAEELGTFAEVKRFLAVDPVRTWGTGPELELDVYEGLSEAEQLLDEHRPNSVCIRYDGHILGYVFPQPGAEPLRGAHLRPILATDFAWPLLKSLALKCALES